MDFKVKSFNVEISESEAKSLLEEISMLSLEIRGPILDKLLWKLKDYYDHFEEVSLR